MRSEQLEAFSTQYNLFKKRPEYAERQAQLCVVPVLRRLIKSTLSNNPLTNAHLTGLIQACGAGRRPDVFRQYLDANVNDQNERADIYTMYENCGQTGITGGGKGSAYGLTAEDLARVRQFLLDAFAVTNISAAQTLVQGYDDQNIREIKQGIYSPWLYYINPALFPIYNASHNGFKDWLGISDNYAQCIADFATLRKATGGEDLGLIDRFAYRYSNVPPVPSRDMTAFVKRVDDFFKDWWRCAPSWQWKWVRDNEKLTMLELDAATDFSKEPELRPQLKKWVTRLAKGDLIVVMDKYYYYGMGIAKSGYQFNSNSHIVNDKPLACIDVEFLHKLDEKVAHNFNISHPNPATFAELTHLGFSPKATFGFLNQNFPEAIDALEAYMDGVIHKEAIQEKIKKMAQTPNTILYGPPGTGKTYNSIEEAVRIVAPDFFDDKPDRKSVKDKFDELHVAGQIQFITFHQSLGYEDFIEGIKPLKPEEGDGDKKVIYDVLDGLFKKLCTEACFAYKQQETEQEVGQYSYEQKKKAVALLTNEDYQQTDVSRFVLIIDEINRGNVSSIFGELITLLEEDKRLGQSEALRARLPYSEENFGVPPNLYVIGTMNTADRSVEALDTALRRRFSFVHKGPQPDLLNTKAGEIDLEKLLEKLNRRLTLLIDADHTIGHAWLMGVTDVEGLKAKFKSKILPLLQEYFYNDYAKLGLVLGDGFFMDPSITNKENDLANFSFVDVDSGSYEDKAMLGLKAVKDLKEEDFIRIYDPKFTPGASN